METDNPHGLVTLRGGGGVDQFLRRAITQIEAPGLDVLDVIDHSGDAYEAGVVMPETKLVLFGSPGAAAGLMLGHPRIALDLPLKLLICEGAGGRVSVSYNAPEYLARRHGLTDDEADMFRVVETIARAMRCDK